MRKSIAFPTSKLKVFTCILALMVAFASCTEKKKTTGESKPGDDTTAPYAEISIKEGGEWQDGDRGHKEYIGGSFKNVDSMTVPEEHTDHTWYIRYEGPGWENQQVGYRLYLDWRNAIDIFGKKVDTLALPYVGREGFDSYHEMAGWGMDILKVGNALGIGGFGRYVDGEVLHFNEVENTSVDIENSDDKASVNIHYEGWETAGTKVDLQSTLSIFPEGRHTKAEFTFSKPIEGFSTGIVDHGLPLMKSEGSNWGYIATYGAQTLVNDTDKLGMAVFYKLDEVSEVTTGEDDHLVVFNPAEKLSYYFLAAWEQEPNGITNQAAFENYLGDLLRELEEDGELE
ncbi:DUF4861 family protein [Gracilimonas mengyeensis]|uniref:DUF4861 domain-containing protein n=1 Tax=Gracilimonas mengyeensis TaxID=1302730 RepID=A0A521BSI3_9BACT|nr:DUF4861 family protein [Gracilimonas mengyeensis]SMO50117.1 protein of unknown function [Gracilimonas mengyeensis]